MKTWFVYDHISPSGKHYIGITCYKKPEFRWRRGLGYCKQELFYRAIRKYGWDNFRHVILYENCEEKFAKEKEIELISLYKQQKISYNMTDGGEGKTGVSAWNKGIPQTEEQKRLNSIKNSGINNGFYGKHHSEESKLLISRKNKGRIPWNKGIPRTAEEKIKISNSNSNKHQTEESNIKRSNSLKGRIVTQETRLKLSISNRGKPKSNSQVEKMSSVNKGKKWYYNPNNPTERKQLKNQNDIKKYEEFGWIRGRGY